MTIPEMIAATHHLSAAAAWTALAYVVAVVAGYGLILWAVNVGARHLTKGKKP